MENDWETLVIWAEKFKHEIPNAALYGPGSTTGVNDSYAMQVNDHLYFQQ